MGYPRRVYAKKGFHVRVETQEQYEQLGNFWKDTPIDGLKVELKIEQAIEMVGEAKKDTEKEPPVFVVEEDLFKVKYKDLDWDELRAYGKKLEDKYKIELPLRSKRKVIEAAIKDFINEND